MALFKTIPEFRKYISIDENMDFSNLLPAIQEAEEIFIKDLLGESFYDILLADYTDHTDAEGVDAGMNADNKLLIPLVQRTLANYAALFAIDQIDGSIGNMGYQESFGNNSRPAPRWKSKKKEDALIAKGDKYADKLLAFLEKNAAANKYNAWFSDAIANTAMAGSIVYSSTIASKYIDINESRRIFLKLKNKIREIESEDVYHMLCEDQYDEIITQIKTGTLSTPNKKLTAILEPFITKKALRESMPYIRLSITSDGLVMQSTTDGVVSKSAVSDNTLIGNSPVKMMLQQLDKEIKRAKENIDQFIIDNISSYPLIMNSPCFTSKETKPPKYQIPNNPDKNYFSV
jgi:hypothetical protein